jgi:hypothetical protein
MEKNLLEKIEKWKNKWATEGPLVWDIFGVMYPPT